MPRHGADDGVFSRGPEQRPIDADRRDRTLAVLLAVTSLAVLADSLGLLDARQVPGAIGGDALLGTAVWAMARVVPASLVLLPLWMLVTWVLRRRRPRWFQNCGLGMDDQPEVKPKKDTARNLVAESAKLLVVGLAAFIAYLTLQAW